MVTFFEQISSNLSNFTPAHQTGITSVNQNVELLSVLFFTMSKLCVISFEVKINSAFSDGDILELPPGYISYGTCHFMCDFDGTCKHAWIANGGHHISIQNGAEKTGNLRGEAVFMIH